MNELDALQETLAAEHAAVGVYEVLGGRVPAGEAPAVAALLRAAYEEHRIRRNELRSRIAALQADPVAAAPAYQVRLRNRAPATLLAQARRTERRVTTYYAQLVAHAEGEVRRWAVEALAESAVRLLDLGEPASAFPGAPELERRS